jgi:hypothetical protein
MNDTYFLILIVIAVVQLGVLLAIYRQTRQGGGGSGASAPSVPKADKEAARRLADLAAGIREKVLGLPATILGPGGDRRLREAPIWSAADIAALHPTSPALAALAGEAAATAEESLTWLQQRVEAIRATPRGSGQHLIDFPHDKWGQMHHDALDSLQQLAAYGDVLGHLMQRGN